MNKKLLLLAATALLMVGCVSRGGNSSLTPSSDSQSSSDSGSSTSSESGSSGGESSSSGGQSSSESSSSSSSSSEEEEDPPTDLGVMSISQAKAFLAELDTHMTGNAYGNWVDKTKTITIKGYAVGKFNLVKTTKNYGLDVNLPGRVVLGDADSYIACQTAVTNQGTSLYGKLDDHVNEDTSRYEVTGYPAKCLGKYEIQVPLSSFTWNSSLDITKNIDNYVDETTDLLDFYTDIKTTQYNCAGHGYDKVYKIESLTCYDYDASSKVFLFTDGEHIVKVLKENCSASVGGVYDVIGLGTTLNYAPAIRAIKITSKAGEPAVNDLTKATDITATNLVKNKTSQDDTNQRFEDYTFSYSKIYKSTVYLGVETHSSKLYVGFTDTFLDSTIEGVEKACSMGFVFIKNDNFWNTTEEELALYNGYYADYIQESNTATVYYVINGLEYKTYSNKTYPYYKVTLLHETIPEVSTL